MDEEELLIAKPEVRLYEIPSGKVKSDSDPEHRAADWDLAHPTWQGMFRIYMAGPCCHVQLDDLQGNTYGQAVLEEYPSKTLKLVMDSSGCFTLNLQNVEGVSKLVGIGFNNREDSSDINSTLKGYFAAVGSRKRKLEKTKPAVSDASPPKKEKSNVVESIYSETNDPDYKYIQEDSFQCHACPLNFNCPKLMVDHWSKIHKQKKAGLCGVCKLPFPYKGERKNHLQKFHVDGVPNPVCKTIIETKQQAEECSLKLHACDADRKSIDPVEITPKFRCSRCSQNYIARFELIEHFRQSHKIQMKQNSNAGDSEIGQNNRNEVNNSSEANSALDEFRRIDPTYPYITGNSFQCHKCTDTFEDISCFAKHWKDDHNLKFVFCGCKLIFLTSQQKRAHREEFHPYVCSVCCGRFVSGNRLEEHLLTEHLCDSSGQKINSLDTSKFRCKRCKYCFCFKEQLRNHVKLKHSKRSKTKNEFAHLSSKEAPGDDVLDKRTCKTCGKIVSSRDRGKHIRLHRIAAKAAKAMKAEQNYTESSKTKDSIEGSHEGKLTENESPTESTFEDGSNTFNRGNLTGTHVEEVGNKKDTTEVSVELVNKAGNSTEVSLDAVGTGGNLTEVSVEVIGNTGNPTEVPIEEVANGENTFKVKTVEEVVSIKHPTEVTVEQNVSGKNSTKVTDTEAANIKNLTEVPVEEEPAEKENLTEVTVEEAVNGKNPTEVPVGENVNEKNPTEVIDKEVASGNNPTEVTDKEVADRKNPTEVTDKEVADRKNPTEVTDKEVADRKNPTEVTDKEVASGKNSTEVTDEEAANIKNPTEIPVKEEPAEKEDLTKVPVEEVVNGKNPTEVTDEEVANGKNPTKVADKEVASGQNPTSITIEKASNVKNGTEEVANRKNPTDITVEEAPNVKNPTEVPAEEEVCKGKIRTDITVEEARNVKNPTEVPAEEEVCKGKNPTDITVEEDCNGKNPTDITVEEDCNGKNPTDITVEEDCNGKNPTDIIVEEDCNGKNPTKVPVEEEPAEKENRTESPEEGANTLNRGNRTEVNVDEVGNGKNSTDITAKDVANVKNTTEAFVEEVGNRKHPTAVSGEEVISKEAANEGHEVV